MSRPIARPSCGTHYRSAFFLAGRAKDMAFFETFVGPDDNWLPPDNYQEHPVAVIAHRTSPTNIGLVAVGKPGRLRFRLHLRRASLSSGPRVRSQTMAKTGAVPGPFLQLVRHAIAEAAAAPLHFDVDSGNLAGHLLTLREGLLALPDDRILRPRMFEGIVDTIAVMTDGILPPEIKTSVEAQLTTLEETRARLDKLLKWAESETGALARSLLQQCRDAASEVDWLIASGGGELTTLRELAVSTRSRANASTRSENWLRNAPTWQLPSTAFCSTRHANSSPSATTLT